MGVEASDSLALTVEVDVDRLRGFFRGPRWVSFNSARYASATPKHSENMDD